MAQVEDCECSSSSHSVREIVSKLLTSLQSSSAGPSSCPVTLSHPSTYSKDLDAALLRHWRDYVVYNDASGKRQAKGSHPEKEKVAKWRMKERMKTTTVGLVLCLNIGVDPPDIMRTSPCARMECWFDPRTLPPPKALDTIGKNLQSQYERWQPKIRYKLSLDPTTEDIKKLCLSLRRHAKEKERALFHYNGHGVPRPTANGEIWVFNHNFTQYIPLAVNDLQSWLETPSIYVFDCSAAGILVKTFNKNQPPPDDKGGPSKENIILAACSVNEILPNNPEFPADIFTACLTTPIKMALKWFLSRSLLTDLTPDLLEMIPGKITERKTPIGELNWIFTAITDTIAWNVLPGALFQRLFRQDLLVASLFRNYLLAERIMRSCNCTPVSVPQLPPTHQHPMWEAWDLAVEVCLSQLQAIKKNPATEYQHSKFFTQQLTAFEVWLDHAAENDSHKPPEQLPIVLQVLLSQVHRLRALVLLGRFLDLGPWAVNHALSVGIFPYILKLLQSAAGELRNILVFIWAKILALDKSCQADLVKDNGHIYFVKFLTSNAATEQRAMAAFVLTVIAEDFRSGQNVCLNNNILAICIGQLSQPCPLLQRWVCLCVSKVCDGYDEARLCAIRDGVHYALKEATTNHDPEVRCAAVCALASLIGSSVPNPEKGVVDAEIGLMFCKLVQDGSPLVRKEAVCGINKLVLCYPRDFCHAAYQQMLVNNIDNVNHSARELPVDGPSPRGHVAVDGFTINESEVAATSHEVAESVGNGDTSQPKGTTSETSGDGDVEESHDLLKKPSDYNETLGEIWRTLEICSFDPSPAAAKPAQSTIANITQSAEEMFNSQGNRETEKKKRGLLPRNMSLPKLSDITGAAGLSRVHSMDFTGVNSEKDEGKDGKQKGRRSSAQPHHLSSAHMSLAPHASQPPMDVEVAPASSSFFEQSVTLFSEPMTNVLAKDDPSDPLFAQRKWRHERNMKLMMKSRSAQVAAASKKLDDQIAILDNETQMTSLLLWHPFEPLLFVADEHEGVSVWNYEEGVKTVVFGNGNPVGSHITSLKLLNEQDSSLLLTGTDDGVVRVWKGCLSPTRHTEDTEPVTLVSAFRALPDMHPKNDGPGLVTDWQQQSARLFVSGNNGLLRVWDVRREQVVLDLGIPYNQTITCMVSHSQNSHLALAGCVDGAVRVIDDRLPPSQSIVKVLEGHEQVVVNVQMQKGGDFQFLSGAVSGDIRFWDLRMGHATQTLEAHRSAMTTLSMHDYAPIIASGSHNQFIKVFNTRGETLSMIRYHDGFLGQRIGPVSCLMFHPHKVLLAAGATDSIISIYSGESHR